MSKKTNDNNITYNTYADVLCENMNLFRDYEADFYHYMISDGHFGTEDQ